jgi:hypothetical protein
VDHRQDAVRRIGLDLFADVESGHVRQLHVQHHEVDAGARKHPQRLATGLGLPDCESGPGQPAHQQITLGGAVVHDENGGRAHDGTTGNRTVKVLPFPGVDSTRSPPPRMPTSRRA